MRGIPLIGSLVSVGYTLERTVSINMPRYFEDCYLEEERKKPILQVSQKSYALSMS